MLDIYWAHHPFPPFPRCPSSPPPPAGSDLPPLKVARCTPCKYDVMSCYRVASPPPTWQCCSSTPPQSPDDGNTAPHTHYLVSLAMWTEEAALSLRILLPSIYFPLRFLLISFPSASGIRQRCSSHILSSLLGVNLITKKYYHHLYYHQRRLATDGPFQTAMFPSKPPMNATHLYLQVYLFIYVFICSSYTIREQRPA